MRTEHISKPLPELTPNSQTLSSKKETPNDSYFSVKIRKRKIMSITVYKLQIFGNRTE